MTHPLWLYQLQALSARFADLGITADLASMSLIELWGVYRYLQRLTEIA
jgi:hypothetical protein